MSTCARVHPPPGGRVQYQSTVRHLQHAKYIQRVYGGDLQNHFSYPGIEFYKTSKYDEEVRGMEVQRVLILKLNKSIAQLLLSVTLSLVQLFLFC